MKNSLLLVLILTAALGLFASGCSSGGAANPTTPGIQATNPPTATSPPVTTAPAAANVTLTVSVEGGGQTVPAAGKYTYPKGTVINLAATGDAHWAFNIWLGPVADTRSTATTITLNSDQTVTAYFAPTTD